LLRPARCQSTPAPQPWSTRSPLRSSDEREPFPRPTVGCLAPLDVERARSGMSDSGDRIKGVLLGQAAGDALGVGYETGKRSHWRAKMIGGGNGFQPRGVDRRYPVGHHRRDGQVRAAGGGRRTAGLVRGRADGRGREHGGGAVARGRRAGPGGRRGARVRQCEHGPAGAGGLGPRDGQRSLARTGPVCLPFPGDRERIVRAGAGHLRPDARRAVRGGRVRAVVAGH